jgi:hypothetical protein
MITNLKKYLPFICLALGLILIAFIAGKCSTRKDNQTSLNNLIAARDSVSQSYVTIAGLNVKVFTKDAIILSKDNALQVQIIENERLKALHIKELITNAQLEGVIRILRDSLKLPPDVQFVTLKDTSGSYLAVRVPYEWKYNDKYVSLSTGIRLNKTGFFELSVPVSGEMSIGYVRSGFLKTKPVGIFTSDNPYLKITDMDILIVKENKKFYQKTWFHMIAGAALFEGGRYLLLK